MAARRPTSDVDESEVSFIDLMACISLMFACLLVLVIWFIAEPEEVGAPPPGQLIVEIVWPNNMDVDVDLWVMGPGEERPVGYSHRKGRVWNLLRDDLGSIRDEMEINTEHAYSRGIPDGIYTVNVHLFSNRITPPPVPVRVTLSIAKDRGARDLSSEDISLTHRGDEQTVFSWEMSGGSFVPDSMERIQRPLREYRRRPYG